MVGRKKIKPGAVDPQDEEALTYELGYLVIPTLTEDALVEQVCSLRKSIERTASVPFSEESPTKRALAYRISRSLGGHREHFDEAYFGSVKFDALPGSIEVIRKELASSANILRYLIIKTPQDSVVPEKIISVRPATHKKKDDILPETRKETKGDDKKELSDEDLDKTIQQLLGE